MPEWHEMDIREPREASYALKQIKQLKAEIAEAEEIAKGEIERIRDWLASRKETLNTNLGNWESMLKRYIILRKDADHSYTLNTPHGRAHIMIPPPKWTWDEPVLLEFLKENKEEYPEGIHIKEEVNKAALKRKLNIDSDDTEYWAVDENGVVLPGIKLEGSEEKLVLSFSDTQESEEEAA